MCYSGIGLFGGYGCCTMPMMRYSYPCCFPSWGYRGFYHPYYGGGSAFGGAFAGAFTGTMIGTTIGGLLCGLINRRRQV